MGGANIPLKLAKGAQAWHVAEVVLVSALNDTWLFSEIAPSKGLPTLNALKLKVATAAKTPHVLDCCSLAFPKRRTTRPVSGLEKCATRHVEVVKVMCPLKVGR